METSHEVHTGKGRDNYNNDETINDINNDYPSLVMA